MLVGGITVYYVSVYGRISPWTTGLTTPAPYGGYDTVEIFGGFPEWARQECNIAKHKGRHQDPGATILQRVAVQLLLVLG